MTSNVPTCSEDTPLAELQRLLAASDAGRVPVVTDGRVVGVVTRSDLLAAYGAAEEEPRQEAASIAERLEALESRAAIFEAVQAVGGGYDGVYLVGGAVRDVLMGEPAFDLDIAVEGDGIAFGQTLADALGGRAVPHEKFGTSIVLLPDGERVDVATTRTEFYDHPAALPRVEQASIRQDLFRRDFTVNAMAASLQGGDFGRLVDPFGGLADLEHGRIRVLHNLSFIDDPTRIFRAIRYENRYGFEMDGHTLSLARACVEMDLVGELSSARLRDELQALLSEDDVAASVSRLRELGIDRSIHPHLAADDEAVRLIAEVDAARDHYAPETPRWRLRLGVLARRLPPDELYDWFERLRLRRRDAERMADAVTVAPRLRSLAAGSDDAATLRALVAPHDPDGALLALAGVGVAPSCGGRTELVRYFEELRAVRLEVSGRDLAELGVTESPRVGEILDELLRRKLNGELDGRAAELAAAEELVGAAR
jgi:tRNA nucleotidyltransferase (CCA-adding enzyme)